MGTIAFFALALVVAPFILASWAAFLHWEQTAAALAEVEPMRPRPRLPRFEAEHLELESFLARIADGVSPLARARATRISLAVSPGRTVWADREGLGEALTEVISTAVCASPGGQVLVSVLPTGAEVQIAVTDDAICDDQAMRETMARGPGELIALQGGRVAVETRRGHGTTVTVRLPAPASGKTEPRDAPMVAQSVTPSGGMSVVSVMSEGA